MLGPAADELAAIAAAYLVLQRASAPPPEPAVSRWRRAARAPADDAARARWRDAGRAL